MTQSPDIEGAVLQVLHELVGKDWGNISLSDELIGDLRIISDDLSMHFVPELERRLDVHVPAKEWKTVVTGSDACALLRRHVESKTKQT